MMHIFSSSKWLGFILGPLLFLLILAFPFDSLTPAAWKVIAVATWMVVWWISEAIPLAATALLPIVLFPSLGIFSTGEATAPYASSIIFLFLGGFLIALALERHKLHERIALNLIKLTGHKPGGIIAGFMASTAALSMWISNTATALMMLPIAISVIHLFYSDGKMNKAERAFSLCLMLSIAYSANIGGMATIIGTPPNVVLVGVVQQILGQQLSFSQWLLMGLPIVIVLLIITFFLLKLIYPYKNMENMDDAKHLIHEKLQGLGKMSTGEKLVLVIFSVTAFSWIFRPQINQLLPAPVLNDTIIAMSGGLLMFIVPINLSHKKFVLHWEDTEKLPWGILILFGGGLSLAKALEKVEIVQMISDAVAHYQDVPYWFVIIILTALVIFMTEIMSNTALATIMIPVVISIGQGLNIDPLLLAVPVALASSCAFMMPVATPPNAIVFSSGHIKMKEMIRAGVWLNIISIGIILLAAMTIVRWLY
jgi:sodium-dependent dicarboxylate transporter 2/3/5